MVNNISQFKNVNDYLPIITAALIVDMIVLSRIVFGYIHIKSLNEWYNRFGLSAIIADVLSILIGIIISRFLYPFIFSKYSLITFIFLTCLVQITHDLSFYTFFTNVSTKKNSILDIFNKYAKEVGITILFADSIMMISTIMLGSYLATLNVNSQIIILVISLYILPYLLYSI